MLVRIDPGSDEPIYLQIASSLAGQIESGSVKAGERLPSARGLGSSLDVNMHTVLKAYAHLQELGYVEMKRGRGGVLVKERPDVERVIRELVTTARLRGMSTSVLTERIGEVW